MNAIASIATEFRRASTIAIAIAAVCVSSQVWGENLGYEASGFAPDWANVSGWKINSTGATLNAEPTSADTVWLNSASIAAPTPLTIANGTSADAKVHLIGTTKSANHPVLQIENGSSLNIAGSGTTDFSVR